MSEENGESPGVNPRVRRSVVIRHLLLSAALWVTYVLYWRIVLHRGVESEVAFALGLLGLFVILQIAFTQAWILHNRHLSQKHAGRRREQAAPPVTAATDFLGRVIEVFPVGGDLTRAPHIVVRVEETRKRFEVGMSFEEAERGKDALPGGAR
jgi:hypothetical protein